jgi:hypothetical protein
MTQVFPGAKVSGAGYREMETGRKPLITERSPAERRPIELLTENGFRIIRLGKIDESIPQGGLVRQFLVRDPDGFEIEITIEISKTVAQTLTTRSRGRLTPQSSYWVCCAERHLAEYLSEQGDYPPDASLTVDRPTLEDLNFARRWGAETT